jgi:exopolyphosphatase/guanosine-5'-triphosphate,3'-diphosphate pyrophosphatase
VHLGVLDIGSNSAQLLVVDVVPGAPPLPAYTVKYPTLLGEELLPDGTLSENGIERVTAAVSEAVDAAVQHDVHQLYPFVTAAVRDAANRDEVVDAVERSSGIRPQYLSGAQEGQLTYLAARRWYGWSAGRLLLIDIGGGSMELVLGRDAEPDLATSLSLGAGLLTRQFLDADPPSRKQIKALRAHIRDSVRGVADRLRWEGTPRRAVATSKTFKQLARLAGAPPQREGPFARRTLTRRDVHHWVPKLAAKPAKQRAKLKGVSSSRARQIVAGAMVADATLHALDLESVEICPWALREGIILRHLEAIAETPNLPLYPLTQNAPTPLAPRGPERAAP